MKIDGIEITYFSDWDGLPVKNHLPAELRERLKTKNQWLEVGFVVKENAVKYEMHPSSLAKKLFIYYLDSDTERLSAEVPPKNCMTCGRRNGRFCNVAGGFISSQDCCSEWILKRNYETI